jgi:hypothetical protein
MDSIEFIEDSITECKEKILSIRLAVDLLEKAYDGFLIGSFYEMEIAIQCIENHIQKLQEVLDRLHSERQL